ncbi:Ribosomal biogenesis protein LAS1L [Orchesella cincta]|uniref:Ribosomal biogenesis protein LAS1L n=1 Tax=Orchesella cincta TaxID=48709 RepID=A0A1D2MIF8_ORCCI|nr:Ribosomal biogenesis protein LAS1L [Orchesella cincta]
MKVKKGKTSKNASEEEVEVEVPSVLLKVGKNRRRNKLRKLKKQEKRAQEEVEEDENIVVIDNDEEETATSAPPDPEEEDAMEGVTSNMIENEEEQERVEVEPPPTKIRKKVGSGSVEDNFIIVPWASRAEWEVVCQQFHEEKYNEVITRIGIWQRRVPTLPVGVEASLFLLEALVYDEKFSNPIISAKGFYTEDQARSLYALAIIRYMNHASQLATQTLGETSSRPARELAAIVDAPEWLVSLRNEVSHGATAPSIEILRMGGNFILHWLREKYWKLPSQDSASTNDLSNSDRQCDEKDIPNEITQLLTAYIAARIYKMRGLGVITDLGIINNIPNCPSPVKTKVAMMSLRNELKSYLLSHSSVLCHVVSQELIPSSEFYEDFVSILETDENMDRDEFAFEKLFGIWLPVIKLLESKGKLVAILGNLCDIFVNPDFEKMWGVTARWIDKLLEVIEFSGKQYSKHLVKLLEVVVKHPNDSLNIFLDRLFRLTEPRLGSDSISKLALLLSIWVDDKPETKKRKKPSLNNFFSINDIQKQTEDHLNMETVNLQSSNWATDSRGEEYWRAIPLGAIL